VGKAVTVTKLPRTAGQQVAKNGTDDVAIGSAARGSSDVFVTARLRLLDF
jgi:hypothetical protein